MTVQTDWKCLVRTYLSSSVFVCAQIICSGTFYLQKSCRHTREQNWTFLLKQDYWITFIISLRWVSHPFHFSETILVFRMKLCVVRKNRMNPCTYQVITNCAIPASVVPAPLFLTPLKLDIPLAAVHGACFIFHEALWARFYLVFDIKYKQWFTISFHDLCCSLLPVKSNVLFALFILFVCFLWGWGGGGGGGEFYLFSAKYAAVCHSLTEDIFIAFLLQVLLHLYFTWIIIC